MNKPNISISLVKSLDKVDLGTECGFKFKSVYIDKCYSPQTTDAQAMGHYLEYLLTGALPRNGEVPQPETTSKGQPTAQYSRLPNHVNTWKSIIDFYNLSKIETGVVLTTDYNCHTIKGILDVLCLKDEEPVIIDIKCTGKIDDKWDEYGWAELWKKPQLYAQAIFYKYLVFKCLGISNAPFYFALFSSTNSESRLIEVSIPFTMEQICKAVEGKAQYAIDMMKFYDISGYKPTTNFRECLTCGFKECINRLKVPTIETVEITNLTL